MASADFSAIHHQPEVLPARQAVSRISFRYLSCTALIGMVSVRNYAKEQVVEAVPPLNAIKFRLVLNASLASTRYILTADPLLDLTRLERWAGNHTSTRRVLSTSVPRYAAAVQYFENSQDPPMTPPQNFYTNLWLYDVASIEAVEEVVKKLRAKLASHPRLTARNVEFGVDLIDDDEADARPGDKLGCYYAVDGTTEEAFWLHEVPLSFYYDGTETKVISREHLRKALFL